MCDSRSSETSRRFEVALKPAADPDALKRLVIDDGPAVVKKLFSVFDYICK